MSVEIKPNIKDFYKGNLSWLASNTIFLTLGGSHSYGTNVATSDVDVKGVCIPPAEYYLGFDKNFEQAEFKEPDGVVFEISKFFKLATESNPNILEILHTDESDWCLITPLGRKLIDNRDLFLSMKAKHTFSGYAMAQAKRINLHYRWIKNPAKAPPTRQEFGLPEKSAIAKDQLSAAMTEIQKKIESWDINWDSFEPAEKILMQERISTMLAETSITSDTRWVVAGKALGFEDNFIQLLQLEQAYKQKCADWNSYQEWKKSRNPARAALEEKYGFDCKHGLHLVRLFRMCREILTTGKVIVKRPDAEELVSIRNGAWTYERLMEWFAKEEAELKVLYNTCTVIPHQPDREKIDKLCVEIVSEFLGMKKTANRKKSSK